MLLWILHVPQTDGSVIMKPCLSTDAATQTLWDAGVEFSCGAGPMQPKVGDIYRFTNDRNKEVAYAVLGQVRFN
jgi:hypothetical protein